MQSWVAPLLTGRSTLDAWWLTAEFAGVIDGWDYEIENLAGVWTAVASGSEPPENTEATGTWGPGAEVSFRGRARATVGGEVGPWSDWAYWEVEV